MRIAFQGLKQAFDYFQIGGAESFIRRISVEFNRHGHFVDFAMYGNDRNETVSIKDGFSLKYYRHYHEMELSLDGKYDHIFTVYILPKDRIKFGFFRKKQNQTFFHFIFLNWPDSVFKRFLYFCEAQLFPYNGKLFCVSNRQYDYVSRWASNAFHIHPPVPENYFLPLGDKPINKKIRITFLGRIDPGKGIDDVIRIFEHLKNDARFELAIYGIHFSDHMPSVRIHNRLCAQSSIKYVPVERGQYSPSTDDFVRNVLKETDIFIQPYQRLSSTIDTPLLLLEAMASLCVVITKPFGNIPDIYGDSPFLIDEWDFVSSTLRLLENIDPLAIEKERKRILKRNIALDFSAEIVGRKFLGAINV